MKIPKNLFYIKIIRTFIQNSRNLLSSISDSLSRPLLILGIRIQHHNEDTIYLADSLSGLPHQVILTRFKKPFCHGYDKNLDSLNHYIFIYPAVALMTILVHSTNRYRGLWDISWTFSIWLECVAIVPQLYIVYKKREVISN